MGSRGASAKSPNGKVKTAASSDLMETVPELIPKEINNITNPREFGKAYASYYKTARDAKDYDRLASAAVSTWIAKNDYNSSPSTTANEEAVFNGAMSAVGIKTNKNFKFE